MKDLEPFEDLDQIQAWLKVQENDRVCCAFAARAALRALPAAMAVVGQNLERLTGDRFLLACLRAVLTCGVASTCPTSDVPKVTSAARSAERSARSAAAAAAASGAFSTTTAAARSATDSATAAAARSPIHPINFAITTASHFASNFATLSDGTRLRDKGIDAHFAVSLWEDEGPISKLLVHWQTFQERPDPEGVWAFWVMWYRGMFEGIPMDWDLQLQVALIDDAVWEDGPKAVAQKIARIRLRHKTLIAPGLKRNSSDTAFIIQSEDALAADILEYACSRVASVLGNALDSAGANGLSEASYETITIRRALTENPKSASLLATGFYDACLSFQNTIGERYPEDTSLTNLKNALWGVVEEINEEHPEARKRCARLAKLHRPPPTSREDKEMAAQVPDMVRSELGDEEQKVLESDVERILSEPQPPIGVKSRFTNWVTTISMWMDKAKKGDQRAQWLAGVVERLLHWWNGDPE